MVSRNPQTTDNPEGPPRRAVRTRRTIPAVAADSATEVRAATAEAAAEAPRQSKSSVAKAKAAFTDFSVSRFAGKPAPSNYVPAGDSPHEAHRAIITRQLASIVDKPAKHHPMTIALPPTAMGKVLSDGKSGERQVQVNDLLKLLNGHLRGRELLSSGHPVLRRLDIQARVDELIQGIKKGAGK